MRSFVIGDIHGEAELLGRLLEQLRPLAAPGDTLIFLGDYIDRGPDSRGVIERVLAERSRWPGPVVTLIGNHEAMLAESLLKKKLLTWEGFLTPLGGAATVRSYGAEDLSRVRFEAHLPAEHRRFLLEELLPYWEDEKGVYVHAGIPQGKHPRDCDPGELIWTAYQVFDFGKPVVVGHEVQRGGRPDDRPERIAIDTGCGFGGPLTAVILPERRYLSVWPDGRTTTR